MIGRDGFLGKVFDKLKHGTEYLNYGRHIVASWGIKYAGMSNNQDIKILDIGMGEGTDLLSIKRALPNMNVNLFGVEYYQPNAEKAKQNGINVYPINIENESVPTSDGYFDIVMANQVIEHTKEIFWIFGEISRVLKKGGVAIVGVPNLASLHNRIALLFGEQPTSIELLSAHVRGFTRPSFTRFITADGYFRILDIKGSNFYPFPPRVSKVLSRLLPTFSTALFFLIQRTDKEGNFIDVLDSRFFETPYFRGTGNYAGNRN